jgi:outer membrane protein OmpA-like peptidoglycan-associated protein
MKGLVLGFATMLLGTTAAHAIRIDDYDGFYGYGGGLYELNDSSRDSDDGVGLNLGVGMPFFGRDSEALEFSLHALQRDRKIDGKKDYQHALFANWVRDLGLTDLGLGAKPYVLVGVGAVQEDVAGDDHLHFGADAGLGALFPLLNWGLAVRAEAIAQAQVNDQSVPDEDYLLDFQVRVGLQVPFDRTPAAPPPAPECPTRVVDPVTGRADCISDSDRDGVADGQDACPATPGGTMVDAKGCTMTGVVDSDGDGVLDSVDACPGTTVGMVVDATGCLVEQSVTLRGINFDMASARLTSDSRVALDEVARTLKNQRNLKAEIVGHTDDAGNDGYNLLLSQQRAESVRQYLIGKGIAPERMVALGMGEAQPVQDNSTEEGRIANRRVEFKVSVQ